MNAWQIEQLIKCLGRRLEQIPVAVIELPQLFRTPYPGKEWLTVSPRIGMDLYFWPQMKTFEVLRFHLKSAAGHDGQYTGVLPFPLRKGLSQSDVHALFGRAHESQSLPDLPETPGPADRWDLYFMDQVAYPGVKVCFQYGASNEVHRLVFSMARHLQD